ncbi:MAG TPA: MOSC domain-containing protein [Natronosporangium sp.]
MPVDLHLDLDTLNAGLDHIRQAPKDVGTVELVIRRPAENEREVLAEVELDTAAGVVGDDWINRGAELDRQVTLMNARVIGLVAQTKERWPLAGDQLYVDFDLSTANLPTGSRIQVGSAVLEVTPAPHRGCKKFSGRFGLDALRFVNSETGYALRMRGMNARVVQAGTVRAGDTVRKLPE